MNSHTNTINYCSTTLNRCGPCRQIAPIYESLSNKYPQAVFLKVDVDDCDTVAASNSVSTIAKIYLPNNGNNGSMQRT